MNIQNNRLTGVHVSFEQTPNTSGKFGAGRLDTIVIHYTAGSSAKSSVRTLTKPSSRASAHLVVGKDGSIIQLADFDTVTWHAGKSSHNGRTGLNKYSIGIEIDNPGKLTKDGDAYLTWYKAKIDEKNVIKATHRNQSSPRYWHSYDPKQVAAVEDICRLLIETYDIKHIVGHEEISPGRKVDPGPAFPLDELRQRLFGGGREGDEAEEEFLLSVRYAANGVIPHGEEVQEFLNKFPGINLKVDGWPGRKSSDAFKLVTGYYLNGDPKNDE